ncbi:DUF3592 domain-containing protein [Herbivorax sp. ANBcel31]|uniref:DUF3592 domain-containing protein n=1 Tax=Herbivorax sp. ANBcel31 TaxID=3069754 RepID=UPI0027B1A138|nr:DUF3592 domain-containing protein [Herbivorax sp. ANBcel31]MDQ2086400.1 DUF3592 domain-containing protein [Herbivorax sp. ANBcel31]
MQKNIKQIKLIVLLIIAILMIFFGIKGFWDKWNISRDGVSTYGIVIEVINDSSGEASTSTISFSNEDGKENTIKSSTGYRRGEKLPVKYKRNNPSKAYIQDFSGKWFWDSFAIILGLILLISCIMDPTGEKVE